MGWQSAMVSSDAAGASTRTSIWKRSSSSARSIARSRSGRSGCPAGVRCSRQAGWEMRSVDIGHIYPVGRSGESPACRRGCAIPLPVDLLPSFPGDLDAGRRRRLVGNKESGCERPARIHLVLLEVGDALAREEAVVDQEMAGEVPRRLLEDEI